MSNGRDDDKKMGPTGTFPEGKLNPTDEGGLNIRVAALPGKVVIEFGKQVSWVGFNPEQARAIAASLTRHAAIAEAANG